MTPPKKVGYIIIIYIQQFQTPAPKSKQKWDTLTGWWFQPLWKIWNSVGMILPNIWKVIKFMFQTTNQVTIFIHVSHVGYHAVTQRLLTITNFVEAPIPSLRFFVVASLSAQRVWARASGQINIACITVWTIRKNGALMHLLRLLQWFL